MNGDDWVHFIRPLWLLALPLAVLLPWLWRRARRPSGDWEKVCDVHLLRWLSRDDIGEDRKTHKFRQAGHWLTGLGIAILVLALAGPSWQQLPDGSFSARDARVIVLDLSTSMLATDLRPDRLTRARFRLDDLLNETQEGQTGLVAFAGDAYVVSPLTTDTNTIANLLPALRPDVMPVTGSRADRGLDLAATLLQRAGFSRGEVLLVSDSASDLTAAKARELRDRGYTTSVLAVGTNEGAPIPSGAGFMTDGNGNVVIARLKRVALQEVAAAGEGKYSELGPSAVAGETPWAIAEGSEFMRREEAVDQRWKDSGPWLVLLLLPLALLGFRRGALFVLPLCMAGGFLHAPDANAGWWEDLWLRRDQQAWQALKADQVERAAALAEAPDISGEAWYRSGGYANALEAWGRQQQNADADYNRGNALAQMGEYDAAIAAYDRALDKNPDMEDARFNRDLVEQMKRKQEQEQQQEQQGEEGEGESQQGDSQQQEGESQDGEQQDGEEQEGEQREGEPQSEQESGEQGEEQEQQDYSESWSEEDAQAMEQWLRRIPDDPGGLLRRKFMNEHQRRGAPEDEPETW